MYAPVKRYDLPPQSLSLRYDPRRAGDLDGALHSLRDVVFAGHRDQLDDGVGGSVD